MIDEDSLLFCCLSTQAWEALHDRRGLFAFLLPLLLFPFYTSMRGVFSRTGKVFNRVPTEFEFGLRPFDFLLSVVRRPSCGLMVLCFSLFPLLIPHGLLLS
ncbi:hypothetical protein IWZ00DRAFT_147826 [Phyllosticta capitalensis]|uniref:Uncharacterized protein n=1 Tax=Phyllosticta capitalensis TaxID=121624 RepID=A0ABR1Z079_9PEZI